MLGCALHNIAQTNHIWFTRPSWWRGITPSQMWKFLILLIARSTCMRKLVISWVFTTSSAGIWLELPRNGGMFKETPSGNRSWMVNPLSAMTESLSSKGKSRKPLLPIWDASCVELTYKYYGTSGIDSDKTFKGCMVFVITKLRYLRDRNAAAHSVDSDIF